MQPSPAATTGRLGRLLGFLEQDPTNAALLGEAATAAFDEGQLDTAAALIERSEASAPATPGMIHLKGMVALARAQFEDAQAIFAGLLEQYPNEPSIRFNLAWSRAMMDDHEGVLTALDDETAATIPNAAPLKVRALHHLGRMDEALTYGKVLAEVRPDDHELMGALATAAIDAEDIEQAKAYAARAGDEPEGLAAMAMVKLDESEIGDAMALFDRALAGEPENPRAAVGKGLALLAEDEPAKAAEWLDKGAEGFGDHLGSWVASGWAYFAAGDLSSSRARFEKGLSIDDTFAELHGSLAVLDIVEGDPESGRRRTEVALRLDRKCFSAALARTLLLTAEGNTSAAERVRDIALNTPLGQGGKTIAQAMTTMAAKKGGVRR